MPGGVLSWCCGRFDTPGRGNKIIEISRKNRIFFGFHFTDLLGGATSYTVYQVPSRSAQCGCGAVVAHHLAKVRVASSNLVIRSSGSSKPIGSLVVVPRRWRGREARQRPAKPSTRVRIPSPPPGLKWAIGAAVARFPDTEEVIGSIPVSPTQKKATTQRSRFCVSCRPARVWVWRCTLVEWRSVPNRNRSSSWPMGFHFFQIVPSLRCG